jgi:3D (Asp-Asp-Asp) domain-containing protein
MLISRSLGRKLSATAIVVAGFVFMYEAKVMDFLDIPRLIQSPSAAEEISIPSQSNHLRFSATAYCKGTTTASGVNVRTGIAAADPELLPVGSVIQVYKLGERYNGIYTIMDTGPAVQGRHIDIYMWSCNEALELGRRDIAINVLRLGWNPKASTPTLIERLFRQREAARASEPAALLPSRPIEIR